MSTKQAPTVNWKNVPTRTITAGGVEFAYRELGRNNPGTPVVFLIHLAAVLDNWDPRVVDGFAAKRRVIAFDNRGVGATSGSPATSIEQMAKDAITFIKAMGLEQVDLFGFSMGGMIAQEIVLMEPQLVRKMIIAGTGPAGGEGISKVARVTYLDVSRHGPGLSHPSRSKAVLVLHQDARRYPCRQGISGAIEGTLAEP
jgi:pimeloyl-ACP methyl ester carboxylesterase